MAQDGSTPLMSAAQNGHNEAVKILVQHGAGVDMQKMVSRHAQIILEYIFVQSNRPIPDILSRITGQEIICYIHTLAWSFITQ